MFEEQLEKARRHLARREPLFKPIIKLVGPCTLKPDPDHFGVLAKSIVSQQISYKAALSIFGRLVAVCGQKGLTAKRLHALPDDEIRACGISGGKLLSLRSLSNHFLEDPKLRRPIEELSDDEIYEHLLPIRGIGRWTVEMFLIFSMGRLDVLPVADLGLKAGVMKLHQLDELPGPAKLTELAETWRPYRTVGTWYLWRGKGDPA